MIRLAVLNFAGACFLAWAWWLGYVARVTEADGAHMTWIIAGLFLVGLLSTFWQALKTGSPGASRRSAMIASGHLYDIFAGLFILGIIGNAIGFLTAFGGVNVADLATPDGMRKAGAQLLSGASTAFGSTIVGLALALWTSANLRVLASKIDRLPDE